MLQVAKLLAVPAAIVACGGVVSSTSSRGDAGPGSGARGGRESGVAGANTVGGGAGGSSGVGAPGGGTGGIGSGGATSTDGSTGAAGSSPFPECTRVVGTIQAGSSCDDTGYCGGVSEGGCILCAVQGPCWNLYQAWTADPDIGAFGVCRANCEYKPDEYCCMNECNAKYPGFAAKNDALVACEICQQCPHDCNATPVGAKAFDFNAFCAE